MVRQTLEANPNNSVIAFHDNSSAIRGYRVAHPAPGLARRAVAARAAGDRRRTSSSPPRPTTSRPASRPSRAPRPAPAAGIRDVHATGRGSLVIAGTAAYCVGNLHIPGYRAAVGGRGFAYPSNLASPAPDRDRGQQRRLGLRQQVRRAADPRFHALASACACRTASAASGSSRSCSPAASARSTPGTPRSGEPEPGMLVVQVGGPAYRIGMGGGAASSMVQGENAAGARLQRRAARRRRDGAEAQPRHPRLRRSWATATRSSASTTRAPAATATSSRRSSSRPGPGSTSGRSRSATQTLSVLEIWGAEYQESNALLLRRAIMPQLPRRCASARRSRSPSSAGSPATAGSWSTTSATARRRSTSPSATCSATCRRRPSTSTACRRRSRRSTCPRASTVRAAARARAAAAVGRLQALPHQQGRPRGDRPGRRASSASGRCSCTVADVAVIAQSHLGTTGGATAIGEQPIKGLLDPAARRRHGRRRGAHQPGLGAGQRASPTSSAPATGCGRPSCPARAPRCYDAAAAAARPDDRARHRDRRRQGQPLDGRAGAADGETVKAPGSAGDLGLRRRAGHHRHA